MGLEALVAAASARRLADLGGTEPRLRPAPPVAEHDEVMRLVEGARLHDRGIGWVDVHLLATTLLSRTRIWTLDRQLAAAARALRMAV